MGTATFDGTRVNSAEALVTGTFTWTTAGAAATLESDYKYAGTYSISCQVKTAEVGMWGYNTATAYNYTSPVRIALFKVIQTNKDAIDGTGLTLEMSSNNSATRGNYYYWNIYSATTYPIAGGWQIVPIDPNVAGYRSGTVGTPALTTVYSYGIRSDASATAKAPNLGIDAVDFIPHGKGLTLTGTSSVFDDFVSFDEGTEANRYGIVSTREGILYVLGVLTIGSAVSSVAFSDSNETIVFPNGRFNTGFCGIDLDLSNASTTILMTSVTMIGRGLYGADGATADTRPDFTVTGTSGTATIDACALTNFNVITLTSGVTMSETVVNSSESLIQAQGIISDCTFDSPPVSTGVAFATVVDPSDISNSSFISSGVGHAIELTSTTGSPFTFTGNTFSGYSGTPGTNLTPSSGSNDAAIYNNSGGAITINISGGDTPSIRNGAGATTTVNNNKTITVTVQNSGAVAIVGAQVAIFKSSDDSVLLASTPTDIDGKVTASVAASIGAIYVRVRQSTKTASFLTTSSTSDGIETAANDFIHFSSAHSFVSGEAVVYSKNGGSQVTGLTDGTTYYLNAVDTDTVSVHATAAAAIAGTGDIALTAGGAETHSFDPVRYFPNSTVGTVGTENVSITVTMIVDTTVRG